MSKVSIVMGSRSDLPTMSKCVEILDLMKIPYEVKVISAHRTPEYHFEYVKGLESQGVSIVVAGAGGAAHLPGVIAGLTPLPVIGVPINSTSLNGLDSLLSIVQMPGGVPVATVAIGEAGAKNAGILATKILSLNNDELKKRLILFNESIKEDLIKNSNVDLNFC